MCVIQWLFVRIVAATIGPCYSDPCETRGPPGASSPSHDRHAAPDTGEPDPRARDGALRGAAERGARGSTLPAATMQDSRMRASSGSCSRSGKAASRSDPQVFFDIQMAIAEARHVDAWVLGVVAVHQFQIALFDVRAQGRMSGAAT